MFATDLPCILFIIFILDCIHVYDLFKIYQHDFEGSSLSTDYLIESIR